MDVISGYLYIPSWCIKKPISLGAKQAKRTWTDLHVCDFSVDWDDITLLGLFAFKKCFHLFIQTLHPLFSCLLWTLHIHHEHQVFCLTGAYNHLMPELVLDYAICIWYPLQSLNCVLKNLSKHRCEFSQQCIWRLWSPGIWCHIVWYTDKKFWRILLPLSSG